MSDDLKTRADDHVQHSGYYDTSRSIGVERETQQTKYEVNARELQNGLYEDLFHGQTLAGENVESGGQAAPAANLDLAHADHWPNRQAKASAANAMLDTPQPSAVRTPRPTTSTDDRFTDNRSMPRPTNPAVKETDTRRRRGPYTRETDRLSHATVTELEGAARHSKLIGSPLNVAVTINLGELRKAGSRRSLATKKPNDALLAFRHSLRRFFRCNGVEHTGIWVREIDFIAGVELEFPRFRGHPLCGCRPVCKKE